MKNKSKDIQNTKENIDWEGISWVERQLAFPHRTIRLGTSFSGIGAIEHALLRLGLNVDILFAGDIDSDCKAAYMHNYHIDENRWHSDIHNLDAKPYKDKIDLLVGGAPCQAFSIRGKRGGFEDTRGTLFSEFARVVIECQPKVFIFENVKGMINHDKGRTWEVIRNTFEQDCGYQVYYQVLNSKDYGIPQSRDRLYCIGFKKERDFKYPAPISLERTVFDFLEKEIDSKYLLKNKGVNFVTRTINHTKSYTQINGDISICQKRNQQFNWHGDFVYHPLAIDEPYDSNDLTQHRLSDFEESYFNKENIGKYVINRISENIYSMTGSNVFSKEYGRFRKLSPRECLNLMGFDKSFEIVVPDTACYKQSGNSIVVDVLLALLKQLDISQYGID